MSERVVTGPALNVAALVTGILIALAALFALIEAVRRFMAPHGPEGGTWTIGFLVMGFTLLLCGALLVTKGAEGVSRALDAKRSQDPAPPNPYLRKAMCSECGRWDGGTTRGCSGCKAAHAGPGA